MESWRVKVHIDLVHCFSAVGSALPARAAACKGGGVHSSKSYVNWVQNVARQFGLYLLGVRIA